MILPAKAYNKVVLNSPAKATINDKNRMIILTALQPSMTLATNFPLIITFMEASLGCGITLDS
jgi:HKD family nuclease